MEYQIAEYRYNKHGGNLSEVNKTLQEGWKVHAAFDGYKNQDGSGLLILILCRGSEDDEDWKKGDHYPDIE